MAEYAPTYLINEVEALWPRLNRWANNRSNRFLKSDAG